MALISHRIVAVLIVFCCDIDQLITSVHIDTDSYACVLVWQLEPGIQSWLSLISNGLYLERYVLRNCYGVGVYYTYTQIRNIFTVFICL